MKYAIVLAVMMTAQMAQAKVQCVLNSGKKDVYGNTLFSGEVNAPKYVMIRNGKVIGETTKMFDESTTLKELQALDGATFVLFAPQETGFSILVGKVDLSKKDNALPISTMVIGGATQASPLSLILPNAGLSALCFDLN